MFEKGKEASLKSFLVEMNFAKVYLWYMNCVSTTDSVIYAHVPD